jgi:NitT/TauT family transport system substrate-binding protein
VRNRIAKVTATVLALGLLAGCGSKPATPETAVDTKKEQAPVTLKIGQIPTIDGLPFWVADQKGYYKAEGVNVELVTFKSANERDTAIMSGAIDGMLADLIASSTLLSSGTKVQITSLALGATKEEGPIAIVAAPNSGITDLTQLKGKSLGISTNSMMHLVADKLLQEAGVNPADVTYTNTPNIPVRFEALMSGQLQAAVLPDPLLSLSLAKGAKLLASDVNAKENLTQSVITFSQKAIQEKSDGLTRFFKAYNHAVADIKANPNAYKDVLVKNANLPKEIVDTYKVVPFSPAQSPKQEDVERVLQWLTDKQLLKSKVTYQDLVNTTVLPH